MATLGHYSGYRFFVFDNEPDARPVLQISSGDGAYARMLLEPLMLLHASGFSREELRHLPVLMREHKTMLLKGIYAQK